MLLITLCIVSIYSFNPGAEASIGVFSLAVHATVNPENAYSGQNFIKRGLEVKKTVSKYGGLTRNLLEHRVL